VSASRVGLVVAVLCAAIAACRGACRQTGSQLASGVIESPDTSRAPSSPPPLYANNEACEWVLTAEPGRRVLLNFSRFVTEAGYDFLTLRDGINLTAPVRNARARSDGDDMWMCLTWSC
jgi:hypothetical protein